MLLKNLLPFARVNLSRWVRCLSAFAAVALLAGCDFNSIWKLNGHQSTIEVAGPVAREQLRVFYYTCWVTFVIFILVGSALAYAMLKFRARSTDDEHAEPPAQGHGNPLVELGLIGASVLALVVIAVPTLHAIWFTYDVPAEEKANAYEVNATGYQWWFRFEYPTEQANVDANTKTPLVTANELVVPAHRPVRINLRTVDVIHSFWIPKLAGKVDMIPNRANFLWFQADTAGYYWGQCAEYCGDSHAVMRFRVVALEEPEFKKWLAAQTKPARAIEAPQNANAGAPKAQFASLRNFKQNEFGFSDKWAEQPSVPPLESWRAKQEILPSDKQDDALIAKGKTTFLGKGCIACHTVRGHGAQGVTAPDLTHVGARTTIAAGLLENTPEQMQRWIHNPGAVKPGNKMAKGYVDNNITLTPDDEVALVAYLQSLK
ncbi:MAG TPA: cytochrome c oxidase subunit II [Opitutaceae bacterium]|nr:cytochrome c oxidase subunit II [Opitutaceae bacterium]